MRLPDIDDVVRIRLDIPELALHRGDVGVVRSKWFAPSIAYEVEFQSDEDGETRSTRALLLPEQLAPGANDDADDENDQAKVIADVGTFFVG
jgi:hypothetical protein